MIRRAPNEDAIDLRISLSQLRLVMAFALGVLFCFLVLVYLRPSRAPYSPSWDDDYDPNFFNYYESPALTEKEINAIRTKYSKPALCDKSPAHPDGCAYATFLSSDDFVELSLILAESLRAVNSKYPMVAFVSDAVSPRSLELLGRAGVRVVHLLPLPLPHAVQPWREYWKSTFAKLQIFQFDNFERLVLIDADSVVAKNLDDLFLEKGEFLTATDRHLCTHETEPGMTSMVTAIWPDRETSKDMMKFFNESGYSFSRGDQGVYELFFERRKSMTLLNETWTSFVFRCQCDDYTQFVGTHSSPKVFHFTGWFRPHVTSSGVMIPVGLSAKAKECGKSIYDLWESLWRAAMEKQGMTVEEFMKERIRHMRS